MYNFCYSYKINPFPNKPWFSCVWYTSLLKTLWEKDKLLVTSNFSFFHSVFYHSVFYPLGKLSSIVIKFKIVLCKLFQFGRVQNLLFGKGLNYSVQQLNYYTFLENTSHLSTHSTGYNGRYIYI